MSANTTGEFDFSLVIPTCDRPRQLAECLETTLQLTYPAARYEIIVVDDGSRESMAPVVAPFFGRSNLTLLRQSNSGPAVARNTGAVAARGRYLAFLDDDCRPDPTWLDALSKCVEANPGCAVGGHTTNGLRGNLFSTSSQLLLQYLYLCWNHDPNDAFFVASNNLAVPRERFLQIQGFDARFPFAGAEDRELCYRWRSQRGRIAYAADAIIHHFHGLTVKAFLTQHFNYGRGAFIFRQIARGSRGKRTPVPAWRFYRDLPRFLVAQERGFRAMAALLLVGLSQIVSPVGYVFQWYVGLRKFARPHLMEQSNGAGIPLTAPGKRASRSRM